jgi:hypothetical protein
MDMGKIAFVAAALLTLAACTQPDDARRTLEAAGYSDIEITGYKAFGCSEDDYFHTGFRATGVNGQPVEGVVCGGWLKGSTIRTQ